VPTKSKMERLYRNSSSCSSHRSAEQPLSGRFGSDPPAASSITVASYRRFKMSVAEEIARGFGLPNPEEFGLHDRVFSRLLTVFSENDLGFGATPMVSPRTRKPRTRKIHRRTTVTSSTTN
jgi:hypothetical protein